MTAVESRSHFSCSFDIGWSYCTRFCGSTVLLCIAGVGTPTQEGFASTLMLTHPPPKPRAKLMLLDSDLLFCRLCSTCTYGASSTGTSRWALQIYAEKRCWFDFTWRSEGGEHPSLGGPSQDEAVAHQGADRAARCRYPGVRIMGADFRFAIFCRCVVPRRSCALT